MIANFLASLLEPAEREAVLGDLAERGASSIAAIGELSGLVLRRQAALWLGWRPWTALLFLIVPFSLVLSLNSSSTADITSVTLWRYFNNWDWNRLPLPPFQNDLPHFLLWELGAYLVLACWSWIVGFAISAFSRHTAVATGTALCLVLLVEAGGLIHANDPIHADWFYRVPFPLMIQTLLVLLPAILGVKQGHRFASYGKLLQAVMMSAAILSAIPILWNGLVWYEHFTNPPAAGPLFNRLIAQRWLGFVNWWPLVYWIAQATRKMKEKTA